MSNSKVKNSGEVLVSLAFFFLPFLFIFLSYTIDSNRETPSVADGFTISAYDVKLDVQEDLKVNVIEKVTVNWYNTNHHGIYKFTPEWYEYTSKDGNTIKRKSVISDYHSLDDPYTVDVVKKKKRIKIGSADSFVNYGDKLYTIAYTYDMGKDPFNGFDEFIFHAYGDYWGTEIKNASIEINLPKSFDQNDIKFFTDKYRKNDITNDMDITINGTTIIAKCKDSLKSALTVDIVLPDNYFVGGSFNYGYKSLLTICTAIMLGIITLVIWFKYGKDYPKRVQTVEFYAPDNLNSAEIGYIYGNKNMKKLTISLIISLASKGYIKIDEEDKKKIKITNLLCDPAKPASLTSLPKRKMEISQLKEPDNKLTGEEKTMMKFLFRKGAHKELNSEYYIEKLDLMKDSLVNRGYIKILFDNKSEIDESLKKAKKNHSQEFEDYEKKLAEYNDKKANLAELNSYEKIVYSNFTRYGSSFYLSENTSFYEVFDDIKGELENNVKKKIKDAKSYSKIKGSIFRLFVTIICCFLAYSVFEDLDPHFRVLYYISFLCVPVELLFTIFMGRKTTYGEEIKAKVLGFRNFLVKVEKDQLERLVSQNPSYFYNILPYTYVLGISRKWINKFENIYYPTMDMGNFDYSSDSSYYDFCSNVYYPAPSHSSGSSGCSSCGGGCSSCGGGCSSCGGGGSW